MATGLNRLFKHTGIYLIGNILNRVGAFVLLPLYTNFLLVSEYGALEIIYSTTAVLSVFIGAGLCHATLRFYFDFKQDKDRHSVVITNLVTSIIFALIGVFLVNIWSQELAAYLFDNPGYVVAFRIALVILVLELSNEILFAYLRALEKSVFFVLLSLVRLVIQVSMSIYMVKSLGMGVLGVMQANLASVAVVWLVMLVYTVSKCGVRIDTTHIKPILRYSLPFAMSSFVGVLMVNVDRFLIKEFATLEEVGIYGLAMKFSLLLMFLLVEPFQRSYGPYRFSIMDRPDAALVNARIAHYLTSAAVFLALGIALFVPEVLQLLSAPAYWPAANIVPILLIGVIASALTYCFETGILIQKDTKYILYITLVSGLVSLVCNIALIPKIGAYGAAISYAVSFSFMAVISNIVSQRYYRVPYPLFKMTSVVVLGLIVFLSSKLLPDVGLVGSIGLKSIFVLIFVIALYFVDSSVRSGIKIMRNKVTAYRAA